MRAHVRLGTVRASTSGWSGLIDETAAVSKRNRSPVISHVHTSYDDDAAAAASAMGGLELKLHRTFSSEGKRFPQDEGGGVGRNDVERGYRKMGDGPNRDQSASGGIKSTPQARRYKDAHFAMLFLAHVAIMLLLYLFAGSNGHSYGTVAVFVVYCSVLGFALSIGFFLAITFMPKGEWIRTSLVGSLNIFLGCGVFSLLFVRMLQCIASFVMFLLSSVYVIYKWRRIQFHVATLETSVVVIKSNFSLVSCAILLQILATLVSVVWAVASSAASHNVGKEVNLLFLMSFLWTGQVSCSILFPSKTLMLK